MGDRALAERLARAAGDTARALAGSSLDRHAKEAPTDIATSADRAAEDAVLEILRAERPGDAVHAEESGRLAGDAARTWVVDALDGTMNFVTGQPHWCAAVALVDAAGTAASAVYDPLRDELFSAGRGEGATRNGERLALEPAPALDAAVVATFMHPPRRGLPGVRAATDALIERVGTLRITGSGSLELAWVAAGRMHGWVQPDAFEWDWLPGELLVREAGGTAEVVDAPTPWHVAAAPGLGAALRELVAG